MRRAGSSEVRHHRSAEQLEQIEELSKAAVGADDSQRQMWLRCRTSGFSRASREKPIPLTAIGPRAERCP